MAVWHSADVDIHAEQQVVKLLVSSRNLLSKGLTIGSLMPPPWWWHIFLPRACSLVLYLLMRFLWLQVNVGSHLHLHLQTLYKLIGIQGVKVDLLYFSSMWFCCYNRGNADFILSSSTAKGGSSQCKIVNFATKQEWPDEPICLSSRTVPHSRKWYSQLLYRQRSSGKRFQNKSKEELFCFLLRSWSNPGLKLWSFSY